MPISVDPKCFDSPQSAILVDGNAENEGRVEICTEDGFRAALCTQGWDERSAQTLCRELGLFQNGGIYFPLCGCIISTAWKVTACMVHQSHSTA